MDRGFRTLLPGLLLLGTLCCFPTRGRAQLQQAADVQGAAEPKAAAPDSATLLKNSPLAADPKAPDELFEATILMVDIARVDLAKLYLNKLMEEPPNDETLLLTLHAKNTVPRVSQADECSRAQERRP